VLCNLDTTRRNPVAHGGLCPLCDQPHHVDRTSDAVRAVDALRAKMMEIVEGNIVPNNLGLAPDAILKIKSEGKMIGVLLVRNKKGQVRPLIAFSGQLVLEKPLVDKQSVDKQPEWCESVPDELVSRCGQTASINAFTRVDNPVGNCAAHKLLRAMIEEPKKERAAKEAAKRQLESEAEVLQRRIEQWPQERGREEAAADSEIRNLRAQQEALPKLLEEEKSKKVAGIEKLSASLKELGSTDINAALDQELREAKEEVAKLQAQMNAEDCPDAKKLQLARQAIQPQKKIEQLSEAKGRAKAATDKGKSIKKQMEQDLKAQARLKEEFAEMEGNPQGWMSARVDEIKKAIESVEKRKRLLVHRVNEYQGNLDKQRAMIGQVERELGEDMTLEPVGLAEMWIGPPVVAAFPPKQSGVLYDSCYPCQHSLGFVLCPNGRRK
jgi:hypothetical protein